MTSTYQHIVQISLSNIHTLLPRTDNKFIKKKSPILCVDVCVWICENHLLDEYLKFIKLKSLAVHSVCKTIHEGRGSLLNAYYVKLGSLKTFVP